MVLLSKVEQDFILVARENLQRTSSGTSGYRLKKKLKEFGCIELALLQDKGF
jgi:hypothetical protein